MITATPNHSKRTFTIRKEGSKFRTMSMSKDEFNELLMNTESDWVDYLRNEQPKVIN